MCVPAKVCSRASLRVLWVVFVAYALGCGVQRVEGGDGGPVSPAVIRVVASATVPVPVLDEHGLLPPRGLHPHEDVVLAFTEVIAVDRQSGEVVAAAVTDAVGAAELEIAQGRDTVVLYVTTAATPARPVEIRDCPQTCSETRGVGAVYAYGTAPATDGTTQIAIRPDNDVLGAFAVRAVVVRGYELVENYTDTPLPRLDVQWRMGSNTQCRTSCFDRTRATPTIFLLGTVDDTDEFDRHIVAHEFGHFVEHAVMQTRSVGGYHDGTPIRGDLAWSEGFSTWLGAWVVGDPIYIDTERDGGAWYDYSESWTRALDPSDRDQEVSEDLVTEVLARLAEREGTAAVFDVLVHHLPAAIRRTGTLRQPDLRDFVDGWICRGHDAAVLQDVVVSNHGFPLLDGEVVCDSGAPSEKETSTAHPGESPISAWRLTIEPASTPDAFDVRLAARSPLTYAQVRVYVINDRDGARLIETHDHADGLDAGLSVTRSVEVGPLQPGDRVAAFAECRLIGGSRLLRTTTWMPPEVRPAGLLPSTSTFTTELGGRPLRVVHASE